MSTGSSILILHSTLLLSGQSHWAVVYHCNRCPFSLLLFISRPIMQRPEFFHYLIDVGHCEIVKLPLGESWLIQNTWCTGCATINFPVCRLLQHASGRLRNSEPYSQVKHPDVLHSSLLQWPEIPSRRTLREHLIEGDSARVSRGPNPEIHLIPRIRQMVVEVMALRSVRIEKEMGKIREEHSKNSHLF